MGIVNTRPLDGDYEKSVEAMWEYLRNDQNAWEGIPGCKKLTLGGAEGGSCSDMVGGAAEAQDHKVAAIREIAKALKEYKVINLTSSPDSAKFAELVKEIAHKLPDPKKASRGVKNSNGIPQKLCARLVHILNDKVNAGISTDAPIEEQCHQAFSITRLLLLGAGSDAFNLHNELKRTFNDIKLLSSLNKEAIDNLVRQAEASKDEKFKNKTAATIKLMKSLQKSIDSIVSAVVSTLYVDLDKDYKDVLTIIENSKSNKEALERLGLPHKKENLAKALGYAFSEVTNLSVMVNQVALALKRLHMNVEQLKNSKTYEDFEEAARKVMHSIPPSEQKKFFESLEVVRQHFGKRDKLVSELSKKGGDDESSAAAVIESADEVESVESKPDNIEGGANYKSKYAKRIKDASIVRGELVKQFLKTFKLHIDKLFSHNKAIIAEFRKQNIKVDDNVNDLFNALSQVQTQLVGPDSKYMSIVLLGVTQRAQDKDRRARFIEALRYLQNVNKRIGNSALVAQNKIIDDMIAVIDKFYDTYQQSRVASKFVKGASVDGGDAYDDYVARVKRHITDLNTEKTNLEQADLANGNTDNAAAIADLQIAIAESEAGLEAIEKEREELTKLKGEVRFANVEQAHTYLDNAIVKFVGGSEYDDMKKSIDSLGKLTDIAQDLNKSIQEIKYYVSISKIKENLKFSAKDIELNQGNYMETLGKAVANKLDTLENELEANIKALEQLRDHGFNAANNIPGYNGPNLYDPANPITFNTQVNVGGKAIAPPGEALHKQIVDSRIAFCKKVYAAKRDFYKVMEAVEIYLTKFNDGMINHPDDIKDIESMLKDGEIVYDWYNEKAGDALAQAFIYARNAHPQTKGLDANGLPDNHFITQDEKDKLVSGKVLTVAEINAIDVVRGSDLMYNVDGVTIGERNTLNGVAVGNRAPYRSPQYPGSVLYTTNNVLESRPLMITGKVSNGAWVVDNQFEKYVDLVSKSYERMDVLKNLVSTFMMIGNKFGSVDLNKVTHIPFGEIYRILTKFLAYSSLSIYDSTHTDDKRGYYGGAAIPYYNKSDLEVNAGPNADAQKTANALNLLSEADRGSKLDTAGYPMQVAGGMDTGEPAGLDVNNNPYNVPVGDGNSGQNVQFGTELIPGRDSLHNVVARSIGGFWSAELELFSYMINAMSAKVFMVMGVYEMMNRPFKTDVATGDPKSAFILDERRYDVPVRIITGGAEMPEIIDDALELYVRLPLLVEFYRDLLSTNGSNRGLGQNQERIGLIADFENVWRDLFHFFFIKHPNRDHSDFGNYELYELVSIINELYRSFKPRSAGKVTTTIVNELIHEINGRIGIVTYEDSKTFYENVDAILRSMDDNAQRDDVIDFKVIPDQDNTYSASGPSAKYRERGSAASSLPDPKKPYDKRSLAHHRNLLEEFLRKYYALMNNASTYRTVNDPSSGLTLVKKLKQVSHDLVQTKDANERFNLVFKTVRTEQELNDVHVLIHVVLHELIGVPLNTVMALHSTLRRLADKYNDTVAYDFATDLGNGFADFKALLKVLSVLNNSYEKYVSVSVSKDYLRVDISKLVSHVKKMVELLRSQLDRFTGVLPAGANILERYRNAITDLEEHLVHRLIEEKKDVNNETSYLADGSSNPNYPSLNKMTKNMEKIWAAVVAGSKGAGQNELLERISNTFVFDVSAGAVTQGHDAVFAGIVDQLLPGYDHSTANTAAGIGSIRLMQNIRLQRQNQSQLLTGAAVNDLNRLITLLAYVMVDESNHKIYKEIINEIGNSTFSEALFNGQNIPNVGNANVINGLDDPSKVLYHSTASIIGKLLVANWKNKTEKAFLWENLSEVPIYAREKMRINLPTFVTFFKRIINDIDLIKDVLNALQLQGTGTYGTASNVTGVNHQTNRTVLGDRAEIPAVVSGQIGVLDAANNNYRHRIAVLDTVKNGVMSMIRSCNKVISELGDSSPKYGDLYEKFFDDYKSAYGKEPIGLYSNLAFVLNGRLSSDTTNANKFLNAFFPTQNVGMDTNFKFKHGVRAVFGKNNKLSLKDFPFINNLVSQYNSYYKVNQKLDTSKFDELISLNTELLRYIHHSKINSIDIDYRSLILPSAGGIPNDHIFFYPDGVFKQLSSGTANNVQTYFVDGVNNANAAEKLAEIVSIAEAKHQKDQLSRTISTVILPGGTSVDLVTKMQLNRPDTNMTPNTDDRKALRILNIFDMNVVPVNIHALRRELPFVSLFSYKFTFQNMVKHALRSEFMYDLSSPGYPTGDKSMKHAALLTECLQSPYRHLLLQNAANNNHSDDNQIMDIIEIVYGHADLPLGRPKFLAEELFEKVLGFNYSDWAPATAHPQRIKNHSKPYNIASTSAAVNASNDARWATIQRLIMDGFNNSTIRTIFYLVNLQRVIRLKMRQDMFWSLGPIVNNIQSIAPAVTEISNDMKKYNTTRRE